MSLKTLLGLGAAALGIGTCITALILFALGSGPVKGFAVTLGLGIITSVFTAIFVTRLFIVLWFERKRPRTIEV